MASRVPSGMFTVVLFLVIALFGANAQADMAERQATIDNATATLDELIADPEKTRLREHIKDANGIFLLPTLVKAGFIIGGSGGSGVLLGRDRASGTCSYPAFYTMGSVSFGLQIGGEVSGILMLVMTRKGMDALLSTDVKLGTDASIAVGPVGTGVAVHTADILLFSRDKGLFGGLTVEGPVVRPRDSWYGEYYGRSVTASDIIVRRNVSNTGRRAAPPHGGQDRWLKPSVQSADARARPARCTGGMDRSTIAGQVKRI